MSYSRNGIVPYGGGKRRFVPALSRYVFAAAPVDTFVSPFVGGGTVALSAAQIHKPKKLILNDKDPSTYAMWKAVYQWPEDVCRRLDEMDADRDQWNEVKEELVDLHDSGEVPSTRSEIVEVAAKRVYSHILGHKSMGPGAHGLCGDFRERWASSSFQRDLRRVHEILTTIDKVEITCRDFREVLDKLDPDALVYLDPPYVERGQEIYLPEFGEREHRDLATKLRAANYQWFLSYGDHELIEELYRDWARVEYLDATYTGPGGRCERTFERVITPQDYPQRVSVGSRSFEVFWDERPLGKKELGEGAASRDDLKRIHAFTRNFRKEGIKYPILVDGDDQVLDGRNRLLAAIGAGLKPEQIPIRRVEDVVTDEEDRKRYRLLTQGTHKKMTKLERGRIVYHLYYNAGMTLREIEESCGIDDSTASSSRMKWEDHLAKPFIREYEEDDGMKEIRPGSPFTVPQSVYEKFERAAKYFGGKAPTWKLAYHLLTDWSEIPERIREKIPAEERADVLTKSLRKYLGLPEDDGPTFGLATVGRPNQGPPNWVIRDLVEIVEAVLDAEEAAAE